MQLEDLRLEYRISFSSLVISDINECAQLQPCDQQCTNMVPFSWIVMANPVDVRNLKKQLLIIEMK